MEIPVEKPSKSRTVSSKMADTLADITALHKKKKDKAARLAKKLFSGDDERKTTQQLQKINDDLEYTKRQMPLPVPEKVYTRDDNQHLQYQFHKTHPELDVFSSQADVSEMSDNEYEIDLEDYFRVDGEEKGLSKEQMVELQKTKQKFYDRAMKVDDLQSMEDLKRRYTEAVLKKKKGGGQGMVISIEREEYKSVPKLISNESDTIKIIDIAPPPTANTRKKPTAAPPPLKGILRNRCANLTMKKSVKWNEYDSSGKKLVLNDKPCQVRHCGNDIPPEVLQELQGVESLDLMNLPIETIDL